MFKLADFAIYVAILNELGEGALQAVTTSLTINFLTRPLPADLIAETRLLKVGRRLVVAEVELYLGGKRRSGGACHRHICAAVSIKITVW